VASNLAELSYDASLRRLDKQEELLEELRARTGLVLAAASLATSFLGRPAFDADPWVLTILALIAFAVSIGASLYVLMPKRNLIFALVGSRVFEELYEHRDDLPEVHRRLTYDLDRFWRENDATMQRVFNAFRVAAWALAAEVGLLLTSLSGTLERDVRLSDSSSTASSHARHRVT
jgi:hypothetical protein